MAPVSTREARMLPPAILFASTASRCALSRPASAGFPPLSSPLTSPMRIVNLNPDTDIGASAWFVEMDGNRLLMDAGAHPKREGCASLPLYSVIEHEDLDAIALTH